VPEFLLDATLAAALVVVAAGALGGRDLFRSVVLFIAFGLLMALTWARLQAPDLALAEAAIGAGITGALLLEASRQFSRGGKWDTGPALAPGTTRTLSALVALAFAAVLGMGLHSLPLERAEPAGAMEARMEETGVPQPVTAVLLVFRGYDTWLETAVLLLAVLGVLVLRGGRRVGSGGHTLPPGPGLALLVRLVVPLLVLVGIQLLWLGIREPGGAFQGGALLASAAVLMAVAGLPTVERLPSTLLIISWLAGVLAFLGVALLSLALPATTLLQLPPVGGYWIILALEAAITVAVATSLISLFLAAEPARSQEGETVAGDAGGVG